MVRRPIWETYVVFLYRENSELHGPQIRLYDSPTDFRWRVNWKRYGD